MSEKVADPPWPFPPSNQFLSEEPKRLTVSTTSCRQLDERDRRPDEDPAAADSSESPNSEPFLLSGTAESLERGGRN